MSGAHIKVMSIRMSCVRERSEQITQSKKGSGLNLVKERKFFSTEDREEGMIHS